MSDVPAPLMFVEPSGEAEPLNVLLYGPPGTGKTVAACSAPGPVLVVNAEGPGALRFARRKYGAQNVHEVTFVGRPTLEAVYRHLKNGDADEQTVVIDSLGEIYGALLEAVGGKNPKIQHYGEVNGDLERFVRSLRDLPVNVVLIAHEQIEDSEEGGAVRRPATGGRKLPESVMAMMDVVAYCGVVPETEDSPRRYVGQLVEERGRRAKDRTGALGKARDLDLSEWVELAHAALSEDDSDLPPGLRANPDEDPPEDAGVLVDQLDLDEAAA
jgi:phage nucleotide-binding protein